MRMTCLSGKGVFSHYGHMLFCSYIQICDGVVLLDAFLYGAGVALAVQSGKRCGALCNTVGAWIKFN